MQAVRQTLDQPNLELCNFNSITHEITQIILNLLPLKDQLNAEMVCREWNQLLRASENETVPANYYRISYVRDDHADELFISNFNLSVFKWFKKFEIHEGNELFGIQAGATKAKLIKEIELTKKMTKKIFCIAFLQKKVDKLRKKVKEELKDYWKDQDKTKNRFNLVNSCIEFLRKGFFETKEGASSDKTEKALYETSDTVDAYVYNSSIYDVIYGEMSVEKNICIPSHQISISPHAHVNAHPPSKDEILNQIKLPCELAKRIDQIVKFTNKIDEKEKEINSDLNFIFSTLEEERIRLEMEMEKKT